MVYLKNFCKWKKIPLILPLNVGNKLVTDFKEKARLFNEYFASKCTPITDYSSLPSLFNLKSTPNLSVVNFTDDDILKIIRSLSINKAYDYDDISIRMIKICDKATLEPLSIIYKNSIDTGMFPDSWKKSNIVTVHKKVTEQLKITEQFLCCLIR